MQGLRFEPQTPQKENLKDIIVLSNISNKKFVRNFPNHY